MAKINAPCKDCADRFPGCQSPDKCAEWAEFAAAKDAYKLDQIATGKMHRDTNAVRDGIKKRRRYNHV